MRLEDFVVTNPLNRLAKKTDVLAMIDSGFLVITEYERQIEYARAEKNLLNPRWQRDGEMGRRHARRGHGSATAVHRNMEEVAARLAADCAARERHPSLAGC